MNTATTSTTLEQQRRHFRFYERVLMSRRVQRLIGLTLVVGLPALLHWGWGFWNDISQDRLGLLAASISAYWVSLMAVYRLSRLPGSSISETILFTLTLCYVTAFFVLKGLEITTDLIFFLASYLVALVFACGSYLISAPFYQKKLAVVPFGKAGELCQSHDIEWCELDKPSLESTCVDGVVADLRSDLPDVWEHFLADCTLHRIPVYHATNAFETLTGRVQLGHLYENRFGSLQPDEAYEVTKRGLDVVAVLLLMPLVLPIMAVTALAIRFDSPGPALFTQKRMGFHCRPFTLYKFRSMVTGHVGNGYTLDDSDPRITRVGRVIRKCRLDELPQLFNVLKGEMSLIGPRPESMELADWYQHDVPFFHYRHVVRPGISGWAQVEQGYAAEVDGMIRKLEYDFYYIKNFSFWLDVLIAMRTIKIVFTGFGAR